MDLFGNIKPDLDELIQEGLVEFQSHPTKDLKIYNYTRKCVYERKWTPLSLACRGLILDSQYKIIAKSFPKFFNYQEEQVNIPLNQSHFYVQSKEDGSLGILFYYENEWIMASKGSFTSDQAIKGRQILEKYPKYKELDKKAFYIFEIIYPENRIVVDYGNDEKLILLSVFSIYKDKNIELNQGTVKYIVENIGFSYPNISKNKIQCEFTLDKIVKEILSNPIPNKEGYVLRFYPSNYRIKVKFNEYVRLHHLLTNFSNINIWEILKDKGDINKYLENVPDEFDEWVRKIIRDLNYQYMIISEDAGKHFDNLRENLDGELPPKKEYSEWVKSKPNYLQPILYRIYDQKDYSQIIWKYIRPKYQKPFWNKEKI